MVTLDSVQTLINYSLQSKAMKKYSFIIFFFAFKFGVAQSIPEYGGSIIVFEITKVESIATVQITNTDTITRIENSSLQSIFNKYKVFQFEQGYKSYSSIYPESELAKVYYIRCNGNYDSLYQELLNFAPEYYFNISLTKNFEYWNAKIIEVDDSNFDVFPNPTKEQFIFIKTDENLLSMNYCLKDLFGRIVLQNKFEENKIHIGKLPTGMYFLTILNQNTIVGYKKITIVR